MLRSLVGSEMCIRDRGSTPSKISKFGEERYSIHLRSLDPHEVTSKQFFGNWYSFTEFFPKMILPGWFIVYINQSQLIKN